ncbi:MAG: SDR family NAD(P)-dependent oxidoreductase, partial [Bacillota bacterium]|nr:SDR family NAD(P)-dependent oxidoreductase [Bacillota bacterium]
MKLDGKVALITGASRGIGSAIALALSKNGASVIINYSKDEQGARETLRQIQIAGGYAAIKQFDIRNYKSCSEAADSIYRQFGKIDILVNNAGISKIGLFIDSTEEDWNYLIDTNLKGTFNMTHSVLKHMMKFKSGSIL